jgi:hypothetical protein
MALKTLSKTNILNGNIVQAADVSQSIDAFTGIEGYAISLSGSFTFSGATTGSGVFQNAVNALSSSAVYIASNSSTDANYTLVFKNDTFGLDGFHPLAADGTNGPYYNPSTNVLGGANGNLIISGSVGNFNTITGSLSGSVNGTSSFATSASVAVTSSIADVATTSNQVSGYYIPSGSAVAVVGILKMFAGAGKTGATPPFTSVLSTLPLDLTGKTLNQNLFLGIAPSQSSATVSATLNSPTSITFVSNIASTDFTFVATYI